MNGKVDTQKTQTADSVQNISFFFTERIFPTKKKVFFYKV